MRRVTLYLALIMLAAYCTDRAMKSKTKPTSYRIKSGIHAYYLYDQSRLIDSIPFEQAGKIHLLLSSAQ